MKLFTSPKYLKFTDFYLRIKFNSKIICYHLIIYIFNSYYELIIHKYY